MRPVVLELNGFAAFREPARIDFTDAEFFALVGPTGAGKSTVIDAMTFALYGSVPRWGRKGMVSLALAPTTARGTVSLVFEVAEQRYVVARELRRMGTQVSQRQATLERLADPRGLPRVGDQNEVLARDLAGVGEAVERLLGLSYEDFCQCVVLPQGQFASFLHAKAAERQEILLRLLGAEHYRQMMIRANQRASDAAKSAETLDETLATFADATQEAQDGAAAAVLAVEALARRVAAARPRMEAADRELSAAEGDLGRLDQQRAALAAVRVPDEVAGLDAALSAGRAALVQARAAEELALRADGAARSALAEAPQRAPLELVRQRRAERDQRAAGLPALRAEVTRLGERSVQAEAAVQAAAAALELLRAQRDAVVAAAGAADERVRELSADHSALVAVAVPDGADRLDARRQAAADALREASDAVSAAERADADARAALGAFVRPGPLEQAQRDLRDLGDLAQGQARTLARLESARDRKAAAEGALALADADREECQRGVDEARRAHVVADLRPQLSAGQRCPVCEQPVRTLPPPLHAPAIGEAQARLDRATGAAGTARDAVRRAVSAYERAAAELDSLTGQRRRRIDSLTAAQAGALSGAGLTALADLLAQEPPGHAICGRSRAGAGDIEAAVTGPDAGDAAAARITAAIAEVEAGLRRRRDLDQAATAAAAEVRAARSRAHSAQAELDRADAAGAAARAELRAARDPLVRLGAPAADGPSLAAAWADLAAWAARLAQVRAAELARAREAARGTAEQRDKAHAEFGQAEADLSELRAAATRAGRAEQEAKTRLDALTGHLAELDRLLLGAPDEAAVTAQLALRDELEAAAFGAGQRLLGARADRTRAEDGLAVLERAEAAARSRLSAARDPLVGLGLGAPAPVAGGGLLAGWTALQTWAARELSATDAGLHAARRRVTAARAGVQELTAELRADLDRCAVDLAPAGQAEAAAPAGIPPADSAGPAAVLAGASAAVAAALARARAASERIAERRREAADLASRRDAAREEHQVARMLGNLLRSDQFPRWLVTAAVDALVADASTNLAGLSGGQFDLAHEDGEFYVIDHADADSRRSVRTLSGGETFQASLALALALSAQMSGLAAAGAARLDSIFLDEGFGTLDQETLDVVATTLETLAQGERMVGVITHVAALAERVPVRFKVTRDARTSSVVREGAALIAGAV